MAGAYRPIALPMTLEPDVTRITQALEAAVHAEPRAAEELLPMVYDQLRRIAQERLAALGPGQTLQATALVHEAWVRVVGDRDPGWDGRAHFFGAAARAMRNILVERSRRMHTRKREGGRVPLDDEVLAGRGVLAEGAAKDIDLLILDEALNRLEARDPLKAQIVMLRFFTGLSMPEVAAVLGVPLTRVERAWRFTRSWLQREVGGIRLD